MFWRLLFAGLFATQARAFAPTPIRIQWGGRHVRNFALAPSSLPGKHNVAVPSQTLMITDGFGTPSHDEIPYFTLKPYGAITWDGLCWEASGDKKGDVVRANHCSGGKFQVWNALFERNQIQLQGTKMCVGMNKERGLNGAIADLRECDGDRSSESWNFEALARSRESPSRNSAHLSSMGLDVIASLWMAGLGSLSLSVWLWRWRKSARATTARQGRGPLDATQGGVSLCVPLVRQGSAIPNVQNVVPAVMATNPTPINEGYMAEQSSTFEVVPERPNFPAEEEATLKYWKEIDAFQESLRQSAGKPPYVFYDGPPFATGLPHYGHILAGTIKDVVTRFAHQRGFYVERRWGWDCHGLPVEHEIDKKFSIKGRDDVEKMGIAKYNEECRSIVTRFTDEWRGTIERFGRWVDFDNDYKTMDLSFMESCWWVCKQLFDKGLIYRAPRVMAFSTALGTPLSNFEVAQNYKDCQDPSVIVQFKMKAEENAYLLAWTTTPWTLPSNVALCVNAELTYLRVKNNESGMEWVVGKDRWAWVLSSIKKSENDFAVLTECTGKDLVGTEYEPLFSYFEDKVIKDKAFRVVCDDYVSTEAGTCIVHQAPAFGEDDNRVCREFGIVLKDGTGMFCPVTDTGCFTKEVPDFEGQHVKTADTGLKAKLKEEGKLVFNATFDHSYPHCPRSDTPLIYKAVYSWFIKVEDVRDKLIKNNNQTYWVPNTVKEKRFHNWLSDARDWCFSRNRFWGTPIPIWVSDDFEEVVCIGSIAELEQYTNGQKVTDLHREFVDGIQIPSKQGKGMLKRVDEVMDCWFESGSMPYSSKHYPFENAEDFQNGFPAQFIAEGLDQTRGWFYTLMILGTHLFDKPPFLNIIVNGLVLAEDGKKMSKRLKNYPDPNQIVQDYGADAVRMYLCNSPVVRAEPLKFKEDGVKGVVKNVFLPWFNAYRFLVQEVARYESTEGKFVPNPALIKTSENVMDRWINAGIHGLIKFVREEIEAYRLYTVVPRIVLFLEDLTNWYVRLNRDRMRGTSGPEEANVALCTLYEVLLNLCILLAPVVPFITELMYKNLARALPDGHPLKCKSVHWVMLPDFDPEALNPEILIAVERLQSVVQLGRTCRDRKQIGQRTPLKSMTVLSKSEAFITDVQSLESYLKEELNVMEVKFSTDTSKLVLLPALNFKVLGKKIGKDMKTVQAAVKNLTQEQCQQFDNEGVLNVGGYDLARNDEEPALSDLTVTPKVKDLDDPNFEANGNSESLVILDFTPDEDLEMMAVSRNISSCVQKLRKAAQLQQNDVVEMWATVKPGKKSKGTLGKVLTAKKEYIDSLLRRPLSDGTLLQGHEVVVRSGETEIDGDILVVTLTAAAPFFNADALKKLTGDDSSADDAVRQFLQSCSLKELLEAKETPANVNYDGNVFQLKYSEHWVLSPAEASWVK